MNEIALKLHQAAREAHTVPQFNLGESKSIDDVYEIQKQSIAQRITEGEKVVGMKLGFTSKAKMEQMGVHDMIWGQLTDSMYYQNEAEIDFAKFIHPRAEPEIAFKLKEDINEQISLEEAAHHVEGIALAIEIIDSRYENFKFSLEDVIADNCSSAAFVVGEWLPAETKIQDISISLSVEDKCVQEGNSNAILGNPWESLINAVRLALKNEIPLKKGMVILAGAATSAEFIQKGQKISATADGLGSIQFKMV